MAQDLGKLIGPALKDVSRSFYLTLRVLPARIRPQIGLAYLLARTTDTIADTGLVAVDQRLAALQALRGRILGTSARPVSFGELARQQASPAERDLLERCEMNLALLGELSSADLERVREVLATITGGQESDLRRFAGASARHVIALGTADDLEAYAYAVAGCVGEFWTKMCRAHIFPEVKLDDPTLLANGVRFGKGLQLVNILRDLAGDLRQGRCYLPTAELLACSLEPAQLLVRANEAKLRPVYNGWLERAKAHLMAGWAYTTGLPYRAARVRLACAWPILIGFETINLLSAATVLDPTQRIKVGRTRIRKILLRSVLLYPLPKAWNNMVRQEASQRSRART